MATAALSNSTYDKLKFVVQIFLPATGSLYFGLDQIWGLGAAEEVVGSISLITLFLGSLLGLSNLSYKQGGGEHDGEMIVTVDQDTGKKTFSLELTAEPSTLQNKESVTFRVVNPEAETYWAAAHVEEFDSGEHKLRPGMDAN